MGVISQGDWVHFNGQNLVLLRFKLEKQEKRANVSTLVIDNFHVNSLVKFICKIGIGFCRFLRQNKAT